MVTVYMGLNTQPGDKNWENLVEQFRQAVEEHGEAEASWSCMGRTRHELQALSLMKALPQFNFTIEGYTCIARKVEEQR